MFVVHKVRLHGWDRLEPPAALLKGFIFAQLYTQRVKEQKLNR